MQRIIQECLRRRGSASSSRKQRNSTHSNHKCYEPEQPSFRPDVHDLPLAIYKPTQKTECSKEDIFQRLTVNKKQQQEKRIESKIKQEEEEFRDNCTFVPKINPQSKRITKTEQAQDDPFERLYVNGLDKVRNSDFLNLSSENEYPFRPSTNYHRVLNTQNVSKKPIYERIQQIIESKRENLKQLQEMEQQRNKENIQLNRKSESIIKNKEQFKKNILQRFSHYYQEEKKKKEELRKEQQMKQKKQCPFRPQINGYSLTEKDFELRQSEFVRNLESKLSSRIAEISSSFRPEINRISELLTREQREQQTWEDKIHRMHNINQEKKQKIQNLEKQLYRECTFQPKLNLISLQLNAQHIKHRCCCQKKEEDFDFHPKINKLSEQIVRLNRNSQLSQSKNSQVQQQQRQQLKMELEYKQMKECTFVPKINNWSRPKKNRSVQNIPGFDQYAKKIEKIQQSKVALQRRNQELFQKEKKYQNRKYTSPKQFKLSQGYNTISAVKNEVEAQFQKKCTFRPSIHQIR